MHERTNLHLTAADRSALEAVVANRNSPQKHVWRAQIVLLTAKGCGTAEIMRATGKAKTGSNAACSDPSRSSKMPFTASLTTSTQIQSPSPGPRTPTKSSLRSKEGTKC